MWVRVLDRALLCMLYAIPLTITWTIAGVHIAIGVGAGFALLLALASRRNPLRRAGAQARRVKRAAIWRRARAAACPAPRG